MATRLPFSSWLLSSFTIIKSISRHRRLTFELAKRELLDRYTGQLFGSAWAIFHPALTVLVFLFLFGEVLKSKVGGGNLPVNNDFTTYLLAGLLPWLVLQDVMTRGAGLVVNQAHLVKQVAFPLDVLPIKAIPPAFVVLLVGLSLLAVYTLLFVGTAALDLLGVAIFEYAVGASLHWNGSVSSGSRGFCARSERYRAGFSFVGIYISPDFLYN